MSSLRSSPDGLLTSGQQKHEVELGYLNVYRCTEAFICEDNVFYLTKAEELNTMSTGEDEPLSKLNGRLRPRKSTTSTSSPQNKTIRKPEGKLAQDRPKRTSTQSKASPSKQDDLATKSDTTSAPLCLCPYCDRKFFTRQTASKHARRIHLSTSKQDNFIECLFCNHSDAESNSIIKHMVDSHPNQYFACLVCYTRLSSTAELAEHKLNICEKQKPTYRSKLRQKTSLGTKKNSKKPNKDEKNDSPNEHAQYTDDRGFNGIVISCELKPSEAHDGFDIEDKITTNLIMPHSKALGTAGRAKNAVIVLDDLQWNKRIPSNFSFHNTDADQILSRLGVVHRSPRVGESRKDLIRMMDEPNEKFEKCFDTSFYSKVAKNVQDNLTRYLDGSFNFNPNKDNTIKTRKSKTSIVINTAEGFPILLAHAQFSRNLIDGFIPRAMAPRHKWKWDSTENDKNVVMLLDQTKRDSHVNNCIVTLISSLDIWTQLRMKSKFEGIFKTTPTAKKTEKQNTISLELKEILESRDIPSTSSQIVRYVGKSIETREGSDLAAYLGLAPTTSKCELQPAVLSGEWVRPRCYVCCACGEQTRDARALSTHLTSTHPNAQVQHYEIVGETLLSADILKHLYVPPSQISNRTRPPRGFRDCTKCKKSITLEDLHQHMLDCAGDTPTVRRKCRYRPFGVRRRRTRLPDNTIRKKMRKTISSRHRQKAHNNIRPRPRVRTEVGDAETIRKMIADLPAKRNRNSSSNASKTRRIKKPVKPRAIEDKKLNKTSAIKKLRKPKKAGDVKKQNESDSDEDDKPLKLSATREEAESQGRDKIKKTNEINMQGLPPPHYGIELPQMHNVANIPYPMNGDIMIPRNLPPDKLQGHALSSGEFPPNINSPYQTYYSISTEPARFHSYNQALHTNLIALRNARDNEMINEMREKIAIQQAHENLISYQLGLEQYNQFAQMPQNEMVIDHSNQRIDVYGAGPSNFRQHGNHDDKNIHGSNNIPVRGGNDGNQNNNIVETKNVPLKHSIASLTSKSKLRATAAPYYPPYLMAANKSKNSLQDIVDHRQHFENEGTAEKLDKPPLSNYPTEPNKPGGLQCSQNTNYITHDDSEYLPSQDSTVSPYECDPKQHLPNNLSMFREPDIQVELSNNPMILAAPGGQPSTFDREKSEELRDDALFPKKLGEQPLLPKSMHSETNQKESAVLNEEQIKIDTDKLRLNKTRKGLNDCIAMLRTKKGLRLDPATGEYGDDESLDSDIIDPDTLTSPASKPLITTFNTSEENKVDNSINMTPAQVFSRTIIPVQYQVSYNADMRRKSLHSEYDALISKQLRAKREVSRARSLSHSEYDTSTRAEAMQTDGSLFLKPSPRQPTDIYSENIMKMRRNSIDGMHIFDAPFYQHRFTETSKTLMTMNIPNLTQTLVKDRAEEGDGFQPSLRVVNEIHKQQNYATTIENSAVQVSDMAKLDSMTTQQSVSPTSRRTRRKPVKKVLSEHQPTIIYERSFRQAHKQTANKQTAMSPKRLDSHLVNANYLPSGSATEIRHLKTPQIHKETYKKVLDTSESGAGIFRYHDNGYQNKILKRSSEIHPDNITFQNLRRHSIESAIAQTTAANNYDILMLQAYRERERNERALLDKSTSARGSSQSRKTIQSDISKISVDNNLGYDRSNELRAHYPSISTFTSTTPDTHGVLYVNSELVRNDIVSNTARAREVQDRLPDHRMRFEIEQLAKKIQHANIKKQRSNYSESKIDCFIDEAKASENKCSDHGTDSIVQKSNVLDNNPHRHRMHRHSDDYYIRSSPYQSDIPNLKTNVSDHSLVMVSGESKDTRDNNMSLCVYQEPPASFVSSTIQNSNNIYSGMSLQPLSCEPNVDMLAPLDLSCDPKNRSKRVVASCDKSPDIPKKLGDISIANESIYNESFVTEKHQRNYTEQFRNIPQHPSCPKLDDELNKEQVYKTFPVALQKADENETNEGILSINHSNIMPDPKNKHQTIIDTSPATNSELENSNPRRFYYEGTNNGTSDQMLTTAYDHLTPSQQQSSCRMNCQQNIENTPSENKKVQLFQTQGNHALEATFQESTFDISSTHLTNSFNIDGQNSNVEHVTQNKNVIDKYYHTTASNVTSTVVNDELPDKVLGKTTESNEVLPETDEILIDQDAEIAQKFATTAVNDELSDDKPLGKTTESDEVVPENDQILIDQDAETAQKIATTAVNDKLPDGILLEKTTESNEVVPENNQILIDQDAKNAQKIATSAVNDELPDDKLLEKPTENNEVVPEIDQILIDQDAETAQNIAMLPEELVKILGTIPKDHRNQLLKVLPQYVSTTVQTVVSNTPHSSTSTVSYKDSMDLQVENKHQAADRCDANKLSVNTAISPSSIIPKKRHSPAHSRGRLNSNETHTPPPILRPTLPQSPDLQYVATSSTNVANLPQNENVIGKKLLESTVLDNSRLVTDKTQEEQRYDDIKINIVNVSNHEKVEKNEDYTVPVNVFASQSCTNQCPMSLPATVTQDLTPDVSSKEYQLNEQTASLRAVRIKSNALRKSTEENTESSTTTLDDPNPLEGEISIITDPHQSPGKSEEEKIVDSVQVTNPQQPDCCKRLSDFRSDYNINPKIKNDCNSKMLAKALTSQNPEGDVSELEPPKNKVDEENTSSQSNSQVNSQLYKTTILDPTSVALQKTKKDAGDFLEQIASTSFLDNDNRKDLTSTFSNVSDCNEPKVSILSKARAYDHCEKDIITERTSGFDVTKREDKLEQVTEIENNQRSEIVEKNQILLTDSPEIKHLQSKNESFSPIKSEHKPVSTLCVSGNTDLQSKLSSPKFVSSNEDDSEDDISLAVIKQKQSYQSIFIQTDSNSLENTEQTIPSFKISNDVNPAKVSKKKRIPKKSGCMQAFKRTEISNYNDIIAPPDIEYSYEIPEGNRITEIPKTTTATTVTNINNDKVGINEVLECNVNTENDLGDNLINLIEDDDDSILPDCEVTELQNDNCVIKNTENTSENIPTSINTQSEKELQSFSSDLNSIQDAQEASCQLQVAHTYHESDEESLSKAGRKLDIPGFRNKNEEECRDSFDALQKNVAKISDLNTTSFPTINESGSMVDDVDSKKLSEATIISSFATAEVDEVVADFQLSSEMCETNTIPLRRSKRGKSLYADASCVEDIEQIVQVEDVNMKTPLTMKRLILSRVEKDKIRVGESSLLEKSDDTIDQTDLPKEKKDKLTKRKKSPCSKRKSKKIKQAIEDQGKTESTDHSNIDFYPESVDLISYKKNKTEDIGASKKDTVCVDSDNVTNLSQNSTSIAIEKICQDVSVSLVKESNAPGKRKLNITKTTDSVSSKSKKSKYIKNKSQSDFDSDDEKVLLEPKQKIASEKHAIEDKVTSSTILLEAPLEKEENGSQPSKNSDEVSAAIPNQTVETRVTCYSRQSSNRRPRISFASFKDNADYDPYDIDLEDMVEPTVPIIKKKSKFNKKCEDIISPGKTPRVTKNMDTILTHESDSDSSKSDVPLQKYADEKALEIELKSKNNKDSFNVEQDAEIKGLTQKRSNSYQTFNAKGEKSHKQVSKDINLCEGDPPATEQKVNTNNNYSANETPEKTKKQKKKRGTVAGSNADLSSDLEQQLLTFNFMQNVGCYAERIPRKSNLAALKKISETFHNMTSSDIEDSYVKKTSKKSTHNEKKKISVTSAEATTTPTSANTTPATTSTTGSQDSKLTTEIVVEPTVSTTYIEAGFVVSDEPTDAMDVDDNNLDTLAAQAIMDSEEIRNLENDLFSCFKQVAEAKLALQNTDMVENADKMNEDVQLNAPTLQEDESCHKIDNNSEANKIPKKIDKPSKQIVVKEKMYPDIEEFDMFEDKFDKIKRKRRSQAVAAKQVQTAAETNASVKSRKQTEKRKTTKSPKKNNQVTHVPTKGALKGFEGIKMSIPTQDLTIPSNVSPPRQQKRRKKATKRRKTSESDSSHSDIDEKEKNVSVKDIYEFKDSEDTELFDLRPSTVMDRFRSMHNKNKFRHKEKDKAKSDMEKEKHKVKAKERKIEIKEREKAQEQEKNRDDGSLIQQNIMDVSPEDRRFVEKDIPKDTIYDVDVKQLNIQEECEKLNENKSVQEACTNDDSKKVIQKSAVVESPRDANKSLNKKEADDAVPSTSGFAHDRIDESDCESELSSPEGEFIFYTSNDVNCVCPSDNDSDESDIEKGCGRLNCMYKNRNADKKAAIGNIFKNNAVRCEKTDTKEPVKPRPDLDQLFDSLFETRPNDDEISGQHDEIADEDTDLLLTRESSDGHESTNPPKSPRHDEVKSKQAHTISPIEEVISFCDDNFSPTGDKDVIMMMESRIDMSEKKESGDNNTSKCELITNDAEMSDEQHNFDNDSTNQMKNKFGYSLVSEECTQVTFADIIANEIEVNEKNAIKTADLTLKTSEDIHPYDSEDEMNYEKPESLTRQYMHFTMPKQMKTSCAQTETHTDKEKDDELAAAEYLKGFLSSEAEDNRYKNKDSSPFQIEDGAETEVKSDDDNVLNKLIDSALKEPESGGSTSIFNEASDESPPEIADSFATPASRSVEMHSPSKSDEGSMNHDYSADAFDQTSFEDTGVARQRARRKCTVGKQNVLAEHWSSESEFDGVPARPNSADSVVASVSRRKKSRKKEGHHSGGRRGSRHSKVGGRRGGRSDDSDGGSGRARAPPGPKMRARPAHHYWSSDSEDSTDQQPQHGWIVGDSHKKLVTMLAHAKGRKRSNGDKLHSRFC